jgi:FkbH-like protein
MSAGVADASTMTTTIEVAATFTVEPVRAALRFWMQELQVAATINFAPYGQVIQQLVDPSSSLSRNHHGINVLVVRVDDFAVAGGAPDAGPQEEGRSLVDRQRDVPSSKSEIDHPESTHPNVADFLSAVTGALKRAPTAYLICFCPASSATNLSDRRLCREMEDRIATTLSEIPGVHVVTSADLLDAYPAGEIFDPHGDRLAHIPYKPAFYTALGTMIARRIYALRNAPYKVVAFDADQTLWSGVCGEDGPLGVGIDPSRQAIQEFLVQQHDAGMILCLCSKNSDEDVAAVFDRRPEMVLRRDQIVGWRVNWSPKSENLRSLSHELQLGLESFVFLDDDPVACADVQANCPEVLTFVLPQNAERIAPFLRMIWAFDHLRVTKEAADRTAFYRSSAERNEFRTESLTLKEFIAGLGLKVSFAPLAANNLARASELTQRTNQFNATTSRRSEAAMQMLDRPQGSKCLVVHVKDRFGDYGVVGAMIFAEGSDALEVDTFLLSCRALGRGVEHRMLAQLGEIARRAGLATVDVPFRPSPKNQPALDFLESVGSDWKCALNDGLMFRIPAERAAAMRYDPPVTEPIGDFTGGRADAAPPAAVDARARAALLASIATELSDVGQIAASITPEPRARPDLDVPYVAPGTAWERVLAGMFGNALGVGRVGINDDFFHLGGDSLRATMLIFELRDAFHVEIPMAILFDAEFTVAEVARTVAGHQKLRASPEASTEALAQLIETLSDDDIRTLLADQSGSVPREVGGEKV